MKFISAIYMPKRNFWCMTRGVWQQKNFPLQKGDGGQSGSQDLRKTVDLSGKTNISSISDPKGTAFRGIHFWFRKKCFYETPYYANLSPFEIGINVYTVNYLTFPVKLTIGPCLTHGHRKLYEFMESLYKSTFQMQIYEFLKTNRKISLKIAFLKVW